MKRPLPTTTRIATSSSSSSSSCRGAAFTSFLLLLPNLVPFSHSSPSHTTIQRDLKSSYETRCVPVLERAASFDGDGSGGLDRVEFARFWNVGLSFPEESDETGGTTYETLLCECYYSFDLEWGCCGGGGGRASDDERWTEVSLTEFATQDPGSWEKHYHKRFCKAINQAMDDEGISFEVDWTMTTTTEPTIAETTTTTTTTTEAPTTTTAATTTVTTTTEAPTTTTTEAPATTTEAPTTTTEAPTTTTVAATTSTTSTTEEPTTTTATTTATTTTEESTTTPTTTEQPTTTTKTTTTTTVTPETTPEPVEDVGTPEDIVGTDGTTTATTSTTSISTIAASTTTTTTITPTSTTTTTPSTPSTTSEFASSADTTTTATAPERRTMEPIAITFLGSTNGNVVADAASSEFLDEVAHAFWRVSLDVLGDMDILADRNLAAGRGDDGVGGAAAAGEVGGAANAAGAGGNRRRRRTRRLRSFGPEAAVYFEGVAPDVEDEDCPDGLPYAAEGAPCLRFRYTLAPLPEGPLNTEELAGEFAADFYSAARAGDLYRELIERNPDTQVVGMGAPGAGVPYDDAANTNRLVMLEGAPDGAGPAPADASGLPVTSLVGIVLAAIVGALLLLALAARGRRNALRRRQRELNDSNLSEDVEANEVAVDASRVEEWLDEGGDEDDARRRALSPASSLAAMGVAGTAATRPAAGCGGDGDEERRRLWATPDGSSPDGSSTEASTVDKSPGAGHEASTADPRPSAGHEERRQFRASPLSLAEATTVATRLSTGDTEVMLSTRQTWSTEEPVI